MTSIDTSKTSSSRSCLAIVLAAGEGTRMKSGKPKVLHQVANRSMVGHVVATLTNAGATSLAAVIGPDREDVSKEVQKNFPDARIFVQRERLGTAGRARALEQHGARQANDRFFAFLEQAARKGGER